MLIAGYVTTLIAPGGVGKTSFLAAVAAHAGLGRGFAGFDLAKPGAPLRSILISNEDDRREMERRLRAVCFAHGLDVAEVMRNVILLPGSEHFFKIANGDRNMKPNEQDLRLIAQKCREHGIAAVFVDPLIETHDKDVNDNQGVKQVMALYRAFAQSAGVAVMIAHHSSKGSGRDSRAGDAGAALGAVAVINSSRVAFTMFSATEDDAATFNIPVGQLGAYVRLDDAKMNLALMSSAPVWFRREGVDLPTGDSVGVVRLADVRQNADTARRRIATTLAREFDTRHIVTASTYECTKMLLATDPIFAEENEGRATKTMQERVEKLLAEPFPLDGGRTIRYVVDKPSDAAQARRIVKID